jgi:hypothetical protein
MTRYEFLDNQYNLSIIAGVNQRYHQQKADHWRLWDTWAKVLTATFAVICVALASTSAMTENRAVDVVGTVVAVLVAAGAVTLSIVPFGEREACHKYNLRRWSDLREEIDVLNLPSDGAFTPWEVAVDRLRVLARAVNRTRAIEPTPDNQLLIRCQKEEERSRRQASAYAA